MKKYLTFITIVLLVFNFSSCKNKEDADNVLIDYQGTTSIKIRVNNCKDSTQLSIKSFMIVPYSVQQINLLANGDSTYETSIKSTRPFLGKLIIEGSIFPIYTIPNDTLQITVDLQLKDSITIEYNGKTGTINDYYLKKFHQLGYNDIDRPLTNYVSPSFTIYEGAKKIDSLFNNELDFLNNHFKKAELPKWFVELEKKELFYHNAAFKLSAISSRNSLCNEKTKLDDSYFDFLSSTPIDNSKAKITTSYFYFLELYYNIKNCDNYNDQCDTNLGNLARAFQSIEITTPQVAKDLSGNNRAILLSYLFSQYYYHCTKSEQIQKLDSVLVAYSDIFNDTTLLNITKDFSVKKLTKINELSSLRKGYDAPYFYLSDSKGDFHSLNDYKGNIIYLNFWATWCSPCIKAIPKKNNLVKEYTDKPIVFINISLDSKEDRWLHYLKENDHYGINLICKGNWESVLKSNYNIQAIPRYILIDGDGKIIDGDAVSPSNKTNLKHIIDKHLNNL